MTSDSSNSAPTAASEPTARADAILRLLDRPVASADLIAGAELAALPAVSASRQSVRLLLFEIGDETAALPAKLLRRVTPLARAIPIPHRTSGVLRGVCNIRGELVLCADLHRLLGLSARGRDEAIEDGAADSRRMIVVGPAENTWAFEVEALRGIESVDPASFRDPPVTVEHARGDFTMGVTDVGGRCVTIFDGERILAGFKAGLA